MIIALVTIGLRLTAYGPVVTRLLRGRDVPPKRASISQESRDKPNEIAVFWNF